MLNRHAIMTAPLALALVAGPALAAGEESPKGLFNPSLGNTDFVVLIGFLLFLAIIFYFNVHAMLMGMLDKRAEGIKADLDEARALREEAQTLLASYERKQREVAEQADRIVANAKADAEAAAEQARADLQVSIARRLQAAEDQIANAETKAVNAVRNKAVEVAIAAAADSIAKSLADADADKMIDASIDEVARRLH
jgi:F-type H+-transporting ATPase subunit b